MRTAELVIGIVVGMAATVFVVEGTRRLFGIDIDPSSDSNIFKRSVDGAVQIFTDDPDETLGGKFFEFFNGAYDPNADNTDPVAAQLSDKSAPTTAGRFSGF